MKRVVAAVVVLFGVGACSLSDADFSLRLGVTVDSPAGGMTATNSEALADYYVQWLSTKRLDSSEALAVTKVAVAAADRFSSLRSGDTDMVFGCTGEFIDVLDPHKGEQLRLLYAEEEKPEPAKWRDISYTTMMAVLPADVAASIPGEAQGCADESLPQNLVAIYRKDLLTRPQRVAVNNATAGMSFDKK